MCYNASLIKTDHGLLFFERSFFVNSYVYKFVWLDKNKNTNTKYIDAPSKNEAKVLFKEWFGFEPKVPFVLITRLTGADN